MKMRENRAAKESRYNVDDARGTSRKIKGILTSHAPLSLNRKKEYDHRSAYKILKAPAAVRITGGVDAAKAWLVLKKSCGRL